jgi:hypothetical protein
MPGEGLNITVCHRTLPYITEGYVVSSYCQNDPARTVYGSLACCVVDVVINNSRAQPLPYTNFGNAPICIYKGQVLGILELYPGQPQSSSTVHLGLEEIFQGLPVVQDTEPENGKAPDRYLYLIVPPEDPLPDFTQANISTEWSEIYQQQIRKVL